MFFIIIMILVIIIIVLIVILIIKQYNTNTKIEGASFLLDSIRIPQNPEIINEIQTRDYYRIPGIDKHAKIDKNGRVEYVTYKKPEPESGEKGCTPIKCPPWVINITCWKCL